MLDVLDAILELVEPAAVPAAAGELPDTDRAASGTIRDRTGAEPFVYDDRPDTVFAFEVDDDRRTFAGTSASGLGEDLVRFAIEIVYVADDQGEEASELRQRAVSVMIDAKRQLYVERIRRVRSGQSWSDLRATVDVDYVRSFQVRGFALRVYGLRHESS